MGECVALMVYFYFLCINDNNQVLIFKDKVTSIYE